MNRNKIIVNVSMNGSTQHLYAYDDETIYSIKRSYLNSVLNYKPTQGDFIKYAFYYEGKPLGESVPVKSLNLSNYDFECHYFETSVVQVFLESEGSVKKIWFLRSIQVNEVISRVVEPKYASSYFLTLKGSPIVLSAAITTSCDVTRKYCYLS